MLLDPCAKDFYFIKDEYERAQLLQQAEQHVIEELGGETEEVLDSGVARMKTTEMSLGRFLSNLLAPEPKTKSRPEEELQQYKLVIRIPVAV